VAAHRTGAFGGAALARGRGRCVLQVTQRQHACVVFELLDGPGGPPDGGPFVDDQILCFGPPIEVGPTRKGGARRPISSNGAPG
jgi:hypothetical protein